MNKNNIQNSKLLKNCLTSLIALSTILVALPLLSITGFNPINLSEQGAQAAVICPSGTAYDSGNNQCSDTVNKTCPSGFSNLDGNGDCSNQINSVATDFVVVSERGTRCNVGGQTPPAGFTKIGYLNASQCQADGNYFNNLYVRDNIASKVKLNDCSPTPNYTLIDSYTCLYVQNDIQSNVIVVKERGSRCNVGGQTAPSDFTRIAFIIGEQCQADGNYNNYLYVRNSFNGGSQTQPATCPSGYNSNSNTTCIRIAPADSYQIEQTSTTVNTGTCNPASIAQTGGTTTCTFPLSGAPNGVAYSLPPTAPTAKIGTAGAASNPCTISSNNLVCTGITSSANETAGVNTVSLSQGNGTAPITLTNTPTSTTITQSNTGTGTCTPSSVAVGTTTTCSFPLTGDSNNNYTLPTTPITASVSTATGTSSPACTITGNGTAQAALSCASIPTTSATVGNQTAKTNLAGETSTAPITITAATPTTTPLTPTQVPGLTASCTPAQVNTTTTCTFTLPSNTTLPSGTTVTLGTGNAGGACTAVGTAVTCTNVSTGSTPGTLPINVVIGGVTTPTGETVVISAAPPTNPTCTTTVCLPTGSTTPCATAVVNSTTTCTFTLPPNTTTIPTGTQIQIGTGTAGGTCTVNNTVSPATVVCTNVPTPSTPGTNLPIYVVNGGVPTLIVGATATVTAATPTPNPATDDRQVKRISLGSSSSNTNTGAKIYNITFSNGETTTLQIINNPDGTICDSLSGLVESSVNGQRYVEFKAPCKQVTIKTYWNSLPITQSYTFQKINKYTNAEYPNFPANISTETRNGKLTIVSTHTVIDNQAGDSDTAVNNIYDPYTLKSNTTQASSPNTTTTNNTTAGTTTVRTGGNQILSIIIISGVVAILGLAFKISKKEDLKN